jgi:hypothetical protein
VDPPAAEGHRREWRTLVLEVVKHACRSTADEIQVAISIEVGEGRGRVDACVEALDEAWDRVELRLSSVGRLWIEAQ